MPLYFRKISMFFFIKTSLLSDLNLIWLNHQPFGIFFFYVLIIHSLVVKTSFLMLKNSMGHGFLWLKNLMEDGKTLRLSYLYQKSAKNIWMNKCSLHQNNFEICWINLEFLGQCCPQTFGNHSEGYTGWKNHCCQSIHKSFVYSPTTIGQYGYFHIYYSYHTTRIYYVSNTGCPID